MDNSSSLHLKRQSILLRLRRLVLLIRTEGGGARRESAAVGIGVFIGCLPLYGFHLLICTAVGTVWRLNRLTMYLAANISNPLVAPWLVLLEVQAGAWLRRGAFHRLTLETMQSTSVASAGADLLAGGVAVGALFGAVAGGITYAMVRRTRGPDAFAHLLRLAADRYIDSGVLAWEFARGKLRADPIYRAVVCGGLLTPRPSGAAASPADTDAEPGAERTLLDVGCGMGLSLALLAEARRANLSGAWPAAWPRPPRFERIVGVELRRRVAAVASAALAADAVVIAGDALDAVPSRCDTVLIFDVLHLLRPQQQDALLAALAAALDVDGVMLIREADAAAGWRFTAVRWGNRLKALACGAWRQSFHFRTASEWSACLARHGLHAEMRAMSEGTPFANVLFVVTRDRSLACS